MRTTAIFKCIIYFHRKFVFLSEKYIQEKICKPTDLQSIIGENLEIENFNTIGQHPIVTIQVDSPKESPTSSTKEEQQLTNLFNEPIDVNLPCDTTNVFYEYPFESVADDIPNTMNDNKRQINEEITVIEAETNSEQPPKSS